MLAILDKRAAGQTISEADWSRVFSSPGYIRLKAREHSMKRAFEDETFRQFVMSDELFAQRDSLAAVLREWLGADISRSAALALAYLPPQARVRATVYPAIKPAKNSFVFDVAGDPAIFIYVEPQPRAVFEATIAHELHHIGYGTGCPAESVKAEIEALPETSRTTLQWISAFGEGIATLAAAGGPSGVPQHRPDVMKEWTTQMQQLDRNFREVEQFFLATSRGELQGEEQQKKAYSFFGIVGPWYTVGWKMAVVIEQTFGRDALIAAMCDQRQLLATYNRAAAEWKKWTGEDLPLWSEELTGLFTKKSAGREDPRPAAPSPTTGR